MAKDPTQKAKLSLKALDLALTTDVTNDYYLQPKLQKCLSLDDLAREVAALSTRQEDAEDILIYFSNNKKALPTFILSLLILRRRHTRHPLEELGEERRVGEVQCVRNLEH